MMSTYKLICWNFKLVFFSCVVKFFGRKPKILNFHFFSKTINFVKKWRVDSTVQHKNSKQKITYPSRKYSMRGEKLFLDFARLVAVRFLWASIVSSPNSILSTFLQFSSIFRMAIARKMLWFFFAVFSKFVALDSADKNAEYIKSEKLNLHAQNPKNVEKITTFFTDFFSFSTTALELLKVLPNNSGKKGSL